MPFCSFTETLDIEHQFLPMFLQALMYSLYRTSVLRGIPGPKPLPFLGILPEMIKKGFHGLDIELREKYGRVVGENTRGTYVGHFPSILVSDPDMIKEIWVKDFQHFSDRPELAYAGEMAYSAVTLARGNHWKFLRNVLSPSFSPAKLKQMYSSVEECTTQMISQISKQSKNNCSVNMEHNVTSFNLKFRICHGFAMDVICSTAFGLQIDSQENPNNQFIMMAKQMTSLKFSNPMFMLQDFLQLMINHYKDYGNSSQPDYTQNKSYESYKERAIGLLFSVYRLMVHPEWQDKLIKEIDREIGSDK
ncbi:hypothetical protein KUTeg_017933 [Tegillarca granosa]|uniref:Cytochrome P450 n=1 Tax=Tegillarca granosa TaxID=220873 RepID=A0ABQ9ELQ6_TEGGR|nr:hypothetical protein KUTeg_017933 [Tegillarca granosa]